MLRRGGAETGVEIDPADGEAAWSTRFYRVQPAPNQHPPEELLRAVLEQLQAWEQQSGHTPFLERSLHPHGIFDPADRTAGADVFGYGYAVLLGTTVLVAAVISWQIGRSCGRAVPIVAATLIGLATVILMLLPPARIPTNWVEMLTNGRTRNVIGRVFGRDLHAGPGYVFLTDLLAPGPGERLRAIVRMNLWASAVSTVLFACLARRLAGGTWAAVVLTLCFAANWLFVNAACSEAPSQVLTLLLLLGAVGVMHINDQVQRAAPREGVTGVSALLQREAGLSLLVLLAIWGWTIREEFAAVGGMVLLAVFAQRLTRSSVRPARRLAAVGSGLIRRGFRSPVIRLAVVLTMCGIYRVLDVRLGRAARALLHGVMPFDESLFTLPLAMTSFVPPALAVLVAIGCCRALRAGGAPAGFVLGLLFLHKLYVALAIEGRFDLVRWWANVFPAAMLLAALGWRSVAQPRQHWRTLVLTALLLPLPWQWQLWPLSLALSQVTIRLGFAALLCWPEVSYLLQRFRKSASPATPRARIAAWEWSFSAMLAGFLLWWPAQAPPMSYDSWRMSFAHPPGYRLVTNQIREARFLTETVARAPDAVLTSEVWRDDGAALDWTFVGAGLEQTLDVRDDGRALPQVVAASVPFARRVLFYRGLDCNLAETGRCFDPPWPVIAEARFPSVPSSEAELLQLPANRAVVLSVLELPQTTDVEPRTP